MRVRVTAAMLTLPWLLGCGVSSPSRLEAFVINTVKHHVTVGDKEQKNPLPDTRRTWTEGQEAFSHYCVVCHGMDGRATGVPFAQHISPPIPPLDSAEVQTYTDGQLKWILENGIRPSGMPGAKGTLSDEELWSIVVFLRHLPAEGSRGVPEMYTH